MRSPRRPAALSGRPTWYRGAKATRFAAPREQCRRPRSRAGRTRPMCPSAAEERGRPFTLDPATGRLYVPAANPSPDFVLSVREGENLYTNSVVVLDAHTGAYLNHFQAAPRDWHDWDVSNTPAVIITKSGKRLLSFAPKNGHLYGVDLATNGVLYRSAVTRVENVDMPLSTDRDTHFCPGSVGGGEWNGVAYDPQTNLIFTGETEWCTTVRLQSDSDVKAVANGSVWMGSVKIDPLDIAGKQDPHSDWAGWLYATDADSGAVEMEAEEQLPDSKRHHAHRRRPRFFRRHGRQLLRGRCDERPETMEQETRRGDRGRRDHLQRRRLAEDRCRCGA